VHVNILGAIAMACTTDRFGKTYGISVSHPGWAEALCHLLLPNPKDIPCTFLASLVACRDPISGFRFIASIMGF
jgi:hypothetical protein